MKHKKLKKEKNKGFVFWFSRVSGLFFVAFIILLNATDIYMTIQQPLYFNFSIVVFTLFLVVTLWNRRSLYSGFSFFALGVINYLASYKTQLITSVLSISIFLVLIGMLFFFDAIEQQLYLKRFARKRVRKPREMTTSPVALRQARAYYKEIK